MEERDESWGIIETCNWKWNKTIQNETNKKQNEKEV